MNVLTGADEKFLRQAMRYFGVKELRVQWNDYSKTKYPDIWCYPYENPPVIVVTAEWNKQNVGERRKRLVHEMLHINGMEHDESIGYVSYPNRDSYSKKVYRELVSNPIYKMSCKKCGYHYKYEGEPYSWETCPICGHSKSFNEFVDK